MALRNVRPVSVHPHTASDTTDPTALAAEREINSSFMAALTNLVPDPTTYDVWVPRPAAVRQTNFGGIYSNISGVFVIGNRVYGMANDGSGHDKPFCYDLSTSSIISIANVSNGNTPVAASTSGAWQPPILAVIGTKLIITHPGFTATSSVAATGTITFAANPSNGDSITLGGTVVTFVTSGASGNQVNIGANLAATLTALQAFLAASFDVNLSLASYTVNTTQLIITYKQGGTVGNTFTLAASAATRSGPTLTGGTGDFFGWIDISKPASLTWYAGNTALNPLLAPPSGVQQFSGRAYFLVNVPNGQPYVALTDSLNPLSITNAAQALTFGDNDTLTAIGGLPLDNQLGGVVQSVIVFKGTTNMYQVTGDPLTSNLAINTLNVATGTLAPNSVTPTPIGLSFIAPDGLRIIDFAARVSDPIGIAGQGINTPFSQALVPSRINSACNSSVIRISTQNGAKPGAPFEEYFFDLSRKVWSGPHTFIGQMMNGYNATFVSVPYSDPGSIYISDVTPTSTSTYTEQGASMTFNFTHALWPATGEFKRHCIVQSAIKAAFSSGATFNVYMVDQNGTILNSTTISAGGSATLWGGFNWGTGVWAGTPNALYPRLLYYNAPVEFERAQLVVTGTCASGVRLGEFKAQIQTLGYFA